MVKAVQGGLGQKPRFVKHERDMGDGKGAAAGSESEGISSKSLKLIGAFITCCTSIFLAS